MQAALLIIIILLALVLAMTVLVLFGLRNINVRLDELGNEQPTPSETGAIPTFKAISSTGLDISDSATMVASELSDAEQSQLHLKEEVLEAQAKLGKTSRVAVEDLTPAHPFHESPQDQAAFNVPCPNCTYVHIVRDVQIQRRYVCPECRTPIEIEDD